MFNGFNIEQGLLNPLLKKTGAHRRLRIIQNGEQSVSALNAGNGLRYFQVAPCAFIQNHIIGKIDYLKLN